MAMVAEWGAFAELDDEEERLMTVYEDAFEATRSLDVFNAAVLRDVLVISATAARGWLARRR